MENYSKEKYNALDKDLTSWEDHKTEVELGYEPGDSHDLEKIIAGLRAERQRLLGIAQTEATELNTQYGELLRKAEKAIEDVNNFKKEKLGQV